MGEAFLEKTKKKKPEEKKVEIKPADLSNRKNKFEDLKNKANKANEEESDDESKEESSEDEGAELNRKPKKSKAEAFLEKTKKKKPEEMKVEIVPADLSNRKSKFEEMKNKANVKVDLPTDQPIRRKKKAPVVEEDVSFLQGEEVQSAPPPQKER